jgi:hypothetical protein
MQYIINVCICQIYLFHDSQLNETIQPIRLESDKQRPQKGMQPTTTTKIWSMTVSLLNQYMEDMPLEAKEKFSLFW